MDILLIFDQTLDIDRLLNRLTTEVNNQPVNLYLFALTSHFLFIEKIQQRLQALPTINLHRLESANYINDQVNIMQKTIHTWSCALGNHLIGGKKIKEWFRLPDNSGSAWWFGLLSEKNSVQDDAFFKIAQINAIKDYAQKNNSDLCLLAIADKKQKNIIAASLKALKRQVKTVPAAKPAVKTTLKKWLLSRMQGMSLSAAIISACIHWLLWLKQGRQARRCLGPLKNRIPEKNPLLFVTYFPNIDEQAAKQGHFRNKYALPLQEKLKALAKPVTWLIMPVFYNGHHFGSSMQLAKTFADKGEKLAVLQEFFTFNIFVKSVFWWLRQSLLGVVLFHCLSKKQLTASFTHPEALPLIRYLWWHSFIGTSSVRGIIFYLTYRDVFKRISQVETCLYFCEMQAWEKALLTAVKSQSPQTKTLAFQHTVVMRNYFNYFYDKAETMQMNDGMDLPLPDRLIANGKLMHALLAESYYPNLCQAEAVRQLYLNHINISEVRRKTDKLVLLVAGSCDRNETKSLITMVYAAFPKATQFDIWFKGSPVNPVEPLFKELGIDVAQTHYAILHKDIAELLTCATLALVANTTVAIEAAACGCTVIVPVFADTMLMNPIVDTQADYFLASTAEAFKAIVDKALQQSPVVAAEKTKHFIHHYWNIDAQLPLWTDILLSQ